MFSNIFSKKNPKQVDEKYVGKHIEKGNERHGQNHSARKSDRVYLDYASITPIDPRVLERMSRALLEHPANPSSLYEEGVEASRALEESRQAIATCLESHADEVLFTSGGTESNNLAIQGTLIEWNKREIAANGLNAAVLDGATVGIITRKPHVISASIEHPSVRELLLDMRARGYCDVTFLDVDKDGIVDAGQLKKSIRQETAIISIMYANNEIGTIQPIAEIAKAARIFKKENGRSIFDFPYVHSDACQAAPYLSLRMPALGIDLMTLDGSKIYGPRSVGILYKKRGIKISPLFAGGSQEQEIRPGTENVSGAAGFALALEICAETRVRESLRLAKLRDQLLYEIQKEIQGVEINGAYTLYKQIGEGVTHGHGVGSHTDSANTDSDGGQVRESDRHAKRLPNNISICLTGMDAEFAVLKLDVRGVCVSSVTSCRTKNEDSSSYVIEALGKAECAKSTLRITLGRFTREEDMKKASRSVIEVLKSFSA